VKNFVQQLLMFGTNLGKGHSGCNAVRFIIDYTRIFKNRTLVGLETKKSLQIERL